MGTQYAGIPSTVSNNLPAATAIASSTAANPTVITTGSNHGLITGGVVDIYSHQTNIGANGQYAVTVTGLTTFSIPVDTSAGAAGGATGSVQSLTPGPSALIPADGVDLENAASVNVPFEANFDRTAWLPLGLGAYKLVKYAYASVTDDVFTTWDSFTFTADTTWTQSTGNTIVAAVNAYPFINNGDLIVAELDFNAHFLTAGTGGSICGAQFALFASMFAPGVSPPAPVRVPGSLRFCDIGNPSVSAGGTNQVTSGLHLSSAFTAGSGAFPQGSSLGIRLYVQAYTPVRANIQSQLISMVGDYTAQIRVYRYTNVLQ